MLRQHLSCISNILVVDMHSNSHVIKAEEPDSFLVIRRLIGEDYFSNIPALIVTLSNQQACF
jgi:hypothetical protein